jgi:myosin heavy subunit
MKQMQEEIARLQQETNERSVLDCLVNNRQPDFSENLPLAAPILFRILQQWDSFTTTKSEFPSKIFNAIRTVTEANKDNNDLLAYWLSNCCTILNLLQKEYPVSLDNDMRNDEPSVTRITVPNDPNVSNQHQSTATSPQSSSKTVGDTDEFAFESPIAKFKNDIIGLTVKIYCNLMENIYKSLTAILIPAMFSSKASGSNKTLEPRLVVNILSEHYSYMIKNHIPKEIILQFFDQVFFYVNAHTFNALFDIPAKRCKMGSAIMMKMAVSELEAWTDDKRLVKCKDQLSSLRQASDIMIMNKASLVDESTRKEVCPTLTLSQVRKVLQLYQPDEFDPDTVPSSVLKALPAPDSRSRGNSTTSINSDKPEVDDGILQKPRFDLDNEIPNWKKVKVPQTLLSQEPFQFLNQP